MERCKVSGKEVISSPLWVFRNQEKQYVTRIKRIGQNILFAWVDSDEPVALEVFEGDLVRKVLESSGLKNKPVYFIWNLERVKDISYAYKRGIIDFLYNPSPPLNSVVFYNTSPEFLNTVESIKAILPSSLKFFFADHYSGAMRLTLEMMNSNDRSPETAENDDYEKLKNSFLAAVARIGWIRMLHQPVTLPDRNHPLHPFFNALSFLQQDLIEQEEIHEKTILNLRKLNKEKTREINARVSSFKEKKEMLLKHFENEKSVLEEKLSFRRNQSRTIDTTKQAWGQELRNIVQKTADLPIDTQQKKQILDICNSLLEDERNQNKTGLPLTSIESIFLSLLHKKHPNLNNRELKICLLIKLNYDNTEIADHIGISKRGMESIRYRMHKKIGLQKNRSLKSHLNQLAETIGLSSDRYSQHQTPYFQ